jgi:hypothetical protein
MHNRKTEEIILYSTTSGAGEVPTSRPRTGSPFSTGTLRTPLCLASLLLCGAAAFR